MIAVIKSISTDGNSIAVDCAYLTDGDKVETCCFKFGEYGEEIGATDSRLFKELFGFNVVPDYLDSEDFESTNISIAAEYITDYAERYINEIVYLSAAPRDGIISPKAVHSYEERPEDKATLESLRRALIHEQE